VTDVPTLHPTSELVAVAWLQAVLTTPVGKDLPEDSADWGDLAFTQVQAVGGSPHIHLPQRQPVIALHFWASNKGSPRPPWNRSAQAAELARLATEAPDAKRQVVIGGDYYDATIQTVYALTEPRPIPGDVAGYGHTQFDMALYWVAATA
jgi:hypothetical protein